MTTYTSKNGTISITDEVSGGYSSESTAPCNARDRNKEFKNVLVDCLNMTKRIAELEKGLKTLSFSEYENIVDINNHNYARYEALTEGNYIKALKEQGNG